MLFSGATRRLAALAAATLAALVVPGTPAIASAATPEAIAADDACPAGATSEDSSCSMSALQRAAWPPTRSSEVDKSSKTARRRPIKVIGVGLPKTGTSSIKVALDMLGYHTVHGEYLDLNTLSTIWSKWEHDKDPWPAINGMRDMGYDAVADRPWCWVYKELLGLYPDAKVIANYYPRGDPKEHGSTAWVDAIENWTTTGRTTTGLGSTLFKALNMTPGFSFSNHMFADVLDCPLGAGGAPGGAPLPPEVWKRCKAGYEHWYDEVKRFVPPAQLLEYTVTEGWGPICKFLEVEDCPTTPFPEVGVVGMVVHEAVEQLLHDLIPNDAPRSLPTLW
uniref:Sulfotransferase domain-containing protein n=1 Tax=Alexandrium catenella TaxID=2925 RepID=A0A7S1W1M8_ALECA